MKSKSKSQIELEAVDFKWLSNQIKQLTDEKINIKVSKWAEKRYLPDELTGHPGFWDNDYAPYLVEPMDRLSVGDPARKIAIMKAAQIGATTGILENSLGYTVDHDPCGFMFVSADKELAKLGVDVKIDRMLESCNLQHKIKTHDVKSRKTGNTSMKKDFIGGFLLAIGAQNPGKLRMMSVRKLCLDELDGMPDKLKNEGDPLELAENRTNAFELTRKILYLSTPLILQTSKINKVYLQGDQRKYFIPCKHCNKVQELVFQGIDEDGKKYGIKFEVDEKNTLIENSVYYQCQFCENKFYNHDKGDFLKKGKWIPTATPKEKNFYSYHINALYSPWFSWVAVVYKWLKAWDIKTDRAKDLEKLKTFYNTDLGLPWEERGEAPKFERIIQHRRAIYKRNEIPNKKALKETGSIIHLLTAAADVHKNRIDLEIVGWCKSGISYSIDWRNIEGDTEILSGPNSPWEKLRNIIESETWKSDDNKFYMVQTTFIDARYRTDIVYSFALEYSSGVYPIMGRDSPVKSAKLREFDQFTSKSGAIAFNINTTLYKDRLMAWMRRDWNDGQIQPLGYTNFPADYRDDYFRHYEAEYKQEVRSKKTNKFLGYYWVQIPNKANHALDCRVYNMAALDLIVYTVCVEYLDFDGIDYNKFWDFCLKEKLYFSE